MVRLRFHIHRTDKQADYTIFPPLTAVVLCSLILLCTCNQYGPRSDCSFRSSLIRVHNVCYIFTCEIQRFIFSHVKYNLTCEIHTFIFSHVKNNFFKYALYSIWQYFPVFHYFLNVTLMFLFTQSNKLHIRSFRNLNSLHFSK